MIYEYNEADRQRAEEDQIRAMEHASVIAWQEEEAYAILCSDISEIVCLIESTILYLHEMV